MTVFNRLSTENTLYTALYHDDELMVNHDITCEQHVILKLAHITMISHSRLDDTPNFCCKYSGPPVIRPPQIQLKCGHIRGLAFDEGLICIENGTFLQQ